MENIEPSADGDTSTSKVTLRVPKRVLHFSDGILEEYSEDEADGAVQEEKKEDQVVDPVRHLLLIEICFAGLFLFKGLGIAGDIFRLLSILGF